MGPVITPLGRVISRAVKKYWLRCAILILVCCIAVISFLNYKYGKELSMLEQRYEYQRESIDNALARWPEHLRQRDTWRQPGLARAAIFSAYLDARPEVVLQEVFHANSRSIWALIRIIAILPVIYDNAPLTCYYRYNETLIRQAPAIATHIIAPTENFGMANSAAFVLCEALTLEDDTTLPWQVSFAADTSTDQTNILEFVDVHYSDRTTTLDQNKFMAVCVPSLHHEFDKWANLVEFVEFYRMMGVEHFTFYKTSVSGQVESVLDYYERKGLATVIKWQLPPRYLYERTLRYNGIFASINDCLYRNTMLGGYKYVVNVDLDEFIVPRKAENFRQMMYFLDPVLDSKNNAVFILRNMFFYLMHGDDPLPQIPSDIPKLLLHTKTTRVARVNPIYDRSKYIVRGQEVVELGNYRVWRIRKTSLVFRTGYEEMEVNPEVAALQHYRYCEVNELMCWLRDTVRDRTAHRFTETLGYRVMEILKANSTIMSHFERSSINPTRVLPYNSSYGYDYGYQWYNESSRGYGYNQYVTPCYRPNGLPCNVSYPYSLRPYNRRSSLPWRYPSRFNESSNYVSPSFAWYPYESTPHYGSQRYVTTPRYGSQRYKTTSRYGPQRYGTTSPYGSQRYGTTPRY